LGRHPGAPERNGGCVGARLRRGGELWTVQYIKEDGTKRFAKNSRTHRCFHVIGAQNGQAAIQKKAMSPVVVIAEGYATAVTFAKHGKVQTLAAYDAGHLLSVATALHQRYPDKAILEDLFERTASARLAKTVSNVTLSFQVVSPSQISGSR
jgi:phage/plasmid primase-like uncharacterized protein